MNVIERKKRILELLENNEYLSVEELVEKIGASKATIRRDIRFLDEKEHLVTRFRGGVTLNETPRKEDPAFIIEERMVQNRDSKIEIGKMAAELIEDGDSIFIDAGSTTYHMIEFITAKDIKVVTNGILNILPLIDKGIETYILDGYVKMKSKSVQGTDAVSKIDKFNFDKAFLGTRGVDKEKGYTSTDSYDGLLKSATINRADKTYVLADESKLDVKEFYTFAKYDEVTLVTNVDY
ncbi:DeoR/GlpR family DNA-binding transcription regulator [Enterococcus avium]|uniref:DeoR/GlpR family DNA-binding transcription regulator n=1 Tax=Enterococcus avium TaxID=33945 RepID=UPI0025B1793D|nr:DeoR/GlpR family DNA-binding transcription regulator [Enterococcus avium]MDN2639834.1 DeoR/GlpR family DNA-binding transcription regulator [Enterococcus avium]